MNSATLQELEAIDLSDHALWRDDPPYEVFAQLRAERPLHFSPISQFPSEPGFWSIVRHEDLKTISMDYSTFSSERGGIMLLDDIGVPLDLMRMQPIAMDPPKHDRMKALFQQAFTPRRIAAHTEVIRAITNHALDGVAKRGECDLVKDVGAHITARVIGSLLGTPEEDDAQLVDWSNIILGYEDPDYRPDFEGVTAVIAQAFEYVLPKIAEARTNPTDDLTTALAQAEVDGDQLTDAELVATFGLLMAAGNDSTRAVYGQSMLALMEHPDQRQMLIDDPSRIEDAVEECLRCFPAFSYMRRTATRDIEMHGQLIKEGDKLALWYISGNRDETVYENPEVFDVTRPRVQHQAFGAGGRHFCLGAALARLELKVMLEETLRRFPDMELAGEPVRAQSLFLNQHKLIPVRFTPES
ncbi:MAG: cytochrome P450 [Thermoleophilaceae bacterium]|nr:cytochrome P450 [Thermoleophilaceae bacterium]